MCNSFAKFILVFACSWLLMFDCVAQTYKSKKNTKQEKKGSFFEHKPSACDFHAVGHSLFGDLNLFPVVRYGADSLSEFDTLPVFSRVKNYNLYHISYHFRYNLYQPDEEKAISLLISPGLGLGLSQSKKINGFGIFNSSLLLGYEWGAGSTYRSIEEKGYFIRAGLEYHYAPLIFFDRVNDEKELRTFLGPVFSAGFRKENLKGKLVETNLKIGWGFEQVDPGIYNVPFSFSRPFSLRISFVIFLDH